MSISKTRQMFVDVARQIFAKKGIANTLRKPQARGAVRCTPISRVRKTCTMPL